GGRTRPTKSTPTMFSCWFVDSEGDLGADLLRRSPRRSLWLKTPQSLAGDVTSAIPQRSLPCASNRGYGAAASRRRAPKLHPPVRCALRIMRDEIGTRGDFSLRAMARIPGLSPSRLMHVSTTSVGVPLRP